MVNRRALLCASRPTREDARNKGLDEGSGVVEHSNPAEGDPHFHATDSKGNKKPGSTHHEYPE